MSNLVCGIGINDGKYVTKVKGKRTDEYIAWESMLNRCKKEVWVKHPTYINTTCSDNFKNYSYFYEWWHQQPNAGRRDEKGRKWQLDKDFLSCGNKVYSETACVFLPARINSLLTKRNAARGAAPIGVYWCKSVKKYYAQCSTGVGSQTHLGSFTCSEEAFRTYKTFKEKLIKSLAAEYRGVLDPRVYTALMTYTVTIDD